MDEKKILSILVVIALGVSIGVIGLIKKNNSHPEGKQRVANNWVWNNNWAANNSPAIEPQKPKAEGLGRQVPTLDEAFRVSGELGLPTCILFTADWCNYCKQLHSEMQKPEVQQALKHYVFVVVDVDKDVAAAKKFQIKGVPNLVITDYTGNVLKAIQGNRDANQVATWLSDEKLYNQPRGEVKAEPKPRIEESKPQIEPKQEPEEEDHKIFKRRRR